LYCRIFVASQTNANIKIKLFSIHFIFGAFCGTESVQIFFAMAQILTRKTINQVFIKDFPNLGELDFCSMHPLFVLFYDCFFNKGFLLIPPSKDRLENNFFQLIGGGGAGPKQLYF
jgi:hypothetical protein